MSTRTIRNGMVWVVAGALAAAAGPVQAETDPTPVARNVPAAPGIVTAPARFLPGPGVGAGLVGVASERVAADATGPRPAPEAVGPRVRARIVGWQLAAIRTPGASLQRTHGQCGALCVASASGARSGSAEVASLKQLVTRVAAGYRLSSTVRMSLSPRVQRVRGQPMTGFSVRIKGV